MCPELLVATFYTILQAVREGGAAVPFCLECATDGWLLAKGKTGGKGVLPKYIQTLLESPRCKILLDESS